MLQKNGKNICALYENKKAQPAWLSYVSVTSADDAAKKAKSLGGKLLQEPSNTPKPTSAMLARAA